MGEGEGKREGGLTNTFCTSVSPDSVPEDGDDSEDDYHVGEVEAEG